MKPTDLCNRHLTIGLWLMIILLATGTKVPAQSIEVGYVKEYNGTAAKTPIEGVELSVKGAPSTVTDKNGRYELHFAILKPGESVAYNDIYKSGYVIFNQDALEYWRISNSRKDFVIVMCKEQTFRELKKKYYNIIDQSYRKEYERQLALLQEKYANDELRLQQLQAEARQEYTRKLSDINNYVELFARIDESEMDNNTALALKYINEGKIDEGIRIYEKLNLQKQTELQLGKLESGENMITLGQQMIDESVEDLVKLADNLQKQIGLYSMGGDTYNAKADSTAGSIIAIYRKLNDMTQGKYNEKLGQWLCFVKRYAEAAALPSIWGLHYQSLKSQVSAIRDRSYLDSLKNMYTAAMEMPHASDSLKDYCRQSLAVIPDFGYRMKSGDTIYIKVLSENTAGIYPLTDYCYNRICSRVLEIPEKIAHQGRTYTITGLAYNAFRNNRNLRHVVLPATVTTIGDNAFAECDSLQTIVMPGKLDTYGNNAVPASTHMILPDNLTEADWIFDRFNVLAQTKRYGEIKLLTNVLKRHKTFRQGEWAPALDFFEGNCDYMLGDTLKAISTLKKWVDQGKMPYANINLGDMYYNLGEYTQAYHYITQAMKDSVPQAFNEAAYLYANGYAVERDFAMAHRLVDTAIRLSKGEANYYDSKGEICLMEGDTAQARKLYDKVMETDPNFYYSTPQSVLYNAFRVDTKAVRDLKNDRIRYYINLTRAIAKIPYSNQYDGFRKIEYEEMLSVGIIALQILIKNKTIEKIVQYPGQYIAAAIFWAITHEMNIRYEPWYNYAYGNNANLYMDQSGPGNEADRKQALKANILRVNYLLKNYIGEENRLIEKDNEITKLKEETETWCREIDNAIKTLPEPAGLFMRDLLNSPDPLVQLLEKHGMTIADYERTMDIVSEYLRSKGQYGFDNVNRK